MSGKVANMMSDFMNGLELSRLFYAEQVKPIVEVYFPNLKYSAALLGDGSEVLGYDDLTSTDHSWGPRLILFLLNEDYERHQKRIAVTLRHKLPYRFRGYSTSFTPPQSEEPNTHLLETVDVGEVNHRVEIFTFRAFFLRQLGIDLTRPILPSDWLSIPEQRLLTITAGGVFHDDLGLEKIRQGFAYFPKDVWLYKMAAGWTRIAQMEHLLGRTGMVGDELGNQLIGTALVQDVMRLCFLLERTYTPYPKWFGTAFKQLRSYPVFEPLLQNALRADDWQIREEYLMRAFEILGKMHNAHAITPALNTDPRPFHNRPIRVIEGGRFANAIVKVITDPELREIAKKPIIGAVDQFSDSTDLLSPVQWREHLRDLYRITPNAKRPNQTP